MEWQKHFDGGVAKMFCCPTPKHFSGLPCCYPLHHNRMFLVQLRHLCVTFLHLNIHVCLSNESPACSFTLSVKLYNGATGAHKTDKGRRANRWWKITTYNCPNDQLYQVMGFCGIWKITQSHYDTCMTCITSNLRDCDF